MLLTCLLATLRDVCPSETCPVLQVDYYLSLQANSFIGNSVSTFTAFVILERQWLGRCAGWQCGSSQQAGMRRGG